MRKLVSILLAAILTLCALPTIGAAAGGTFTLMVYLCGTDLESKGGMATDDLLEMVKAGVSPNSGLNVVIQTGGTRSWQADGITNKKVERWALTQRSISLLESVGSADMGDASTLADFISFGASNFPADRYGLILWDHGMGSAGGVCYDEITGDSLYMDEISAALAKARKQAGIKKLAFVGFDACLMATYEMANTLSPHAEYMIASEELEPGTGWSYNSWLPALASDPSIDIPTLGKSIVDSFIRGTVSFDRREFATLSVIDLSKMAALRKAVESMSESLNAELSGGNLTGISRIRQNLRSFGESSDAASDMIDMGVFADAYSQFDKTNAKKVKSALSKAVVYSSHTNNLSNISGMSILVPYTTKNSASQYLGSYDKDNQSPNYKRFVSTLINEMTSYGGYSFSSAGVQQQSLQDAQIDWFSQYSSDQSSYYDTYESLYSGTGSQDDFSLDSFLSTLFGSDSGAELTQGSSIWGSMDDEADTSFIQNSSVTGATLGTDAPTVNVNTPSGTVSLQNPFSGASGDYAYTVTLSKEDLRYLAKAEANLLMDLSDDDGEFYVELGYSNDVFVDWEKGVIYGLLDGSWPCVEGQLVCMYTQVSNERYVRSLAPVLINDTETYLLIVFDEENPKGEVIGYTEGYTDSGMPARGYHKLEPGDEITPEYEILYWDEDGNQKTEPFYGDTFTVGRDGKLEFSYESLSDGSDEGTAYAYGFCLTDIFGDYQFTDFTTIVY